MRYIIAPLDIKEDEFRVYKYLWSKCDFKTMTCEYTERNILIDIKADFSRKRLQNIFRMFTDMNLFIILEKGTKGKPSKLFINKEVLWSQIGAELEPNRNQITVENTSLKGIKEPNRNQIGTTKVPSIKEVKNKEINNIYIEDLWNLYPNKKGKSIAIKKIPKLLKKYSKEELERCITRYSNEVKGKEKQYILNGSTFFNGRYEDYLDCNFTTIATEPTHSSVKDNFDY